jgi:hypothetical protein
MPQETFGEKAGNKLEEGLEQVKSSVKDLAAKAGIGSGDAESAPASGRRGSRSRTAASAGRSHGGSAATRARSGATRAKSGATRAAKSGATRAKSGVTRTRDELYADAARLGIKGRSKMTKAELEKAVRRG